MKRLLMSLLAGLVTLIVFGAVAICVVYGLSFAYNVDSDADFAIVMGFLWILISLVYFLVVK